MIRKHITFIWLALFLFSGFVALLYQVVWTKRLGLILGVDIYGVTAVLLAFMLGFAFGGKWGGHWADRSVSPGRLYAKIEFGIALFALATPWLFEQLQSAYPSLYQHSDGLPSWRVSLQFFLAVALLVIPTFLMGASFPLMGRIISEHQSPGKSGALFYASNTLGAAFGALVTGFWLLPIFGLNESLYAGVGLQVLVAAFAALAVRLTAIREGSMAFPFPVSTWSDDRPASGVAPALFLSGFAALAYEVLLTRGLTMRLGSSSYAFSMVLGIFLIGIGLGAFFFPRKWEKPGTARIVFVFSQLAAALGALIGPILLMRSSGDQNLSSGAIYRYPEVSSQWGFIAYGVGVASLALLPLAISLGVSLPAALRAGVGESRQIGRIYGQLYWWNTLGAAMGSVAATFVLIPSLGSDLSLALLAALNLAAALWVGWGNLQGAAQGWFRMGIANVVVIAVLFAIPLTQKSGVVYSKEGPTTCVEVENQILGFEGRHNQLLRVGGRVEASTYFLDQRLQKLQGHIPALLHPAPKNALVIGMGTGMTAGAVAIHPEIQSVDLVEISPEVVEASHFFARQNHLQDEVGKKVRVLLEDARNFLLGSKSRYDLITADPIQPWKTGAGNLYTVEYFTLAKNHLSEDGRGVLAQWIPLYQMSWVDVQSILASLVAVFPHRQLWLTGYDLVLIGSEHPLQLDETRFVSRLTHPAIQSDLENIAIHNAASLFALYLGNDVFVEALARGGKLNRDLHPTLEYSAPFSMWKGYPFEAFERILRTRDAQLPFAASKEFHDRWSFARTNLDRAVREFLSSAARLDCRGDEAEEAYRKALESH